MTKHRDFIRSTPGGTGVNAQAVTLKKHVDSSTWQSGTTDANGLYEETFDGSGGPIFEESTYSGQTKRRSGKSTGQVGVWWLSNHPHQIRMMSGKGVIPDFTAPGIADNEMSVAPGSGLQVQVATGACMIDGDIYICSATTNLAVTANSSGSTRTDRIIIRYTREGQTEEGKCELRMLDGTPGAGAPSLTNSDSVSEYSLAKLTVINGASSFVGGDLTDERYDTTLNQAYAFSYPTGLRNGDIFIVSGGKLTRLAVGSNGQFLNVASSLPAWASSLSLDSATAFAIKTAGGSNRFLVDTTNGEVELRGGADLRVFSDDGTTEKASIDGATGNVQTDGNLTVDGNVDVNGTGTFDSATTDAYAFRNGTSRRVVIDNNNGVLRLVNGVDLRTYSDDGTTEKFSLLGESGNLTSLGTLDAGVITGSRFASSSAIGGITATPAGTFPGAGTSPSGVSVVGSDVCGTITMTIGTSPSNGDVCRITFGTAKADANYVVLYSARSSAATTDIAKIKSDSIGTNSFDLNAVFALSAGSTYIWDYLVMEY